MLLHDGLQSLGLSVSLSPQHLPARYQHLPHVLSGSSTQGVQLEPDACWCLYGPVSLGQRTWGRDVPQQCKDGSHTEEGREPPQPCCLPGSKDPRPGLQTSLLKSHSPRGSCSRWHLLPPTSGCHSFPGYRGLKIAQKRPRSSCGFNLDGQAARGPLSGAAPRPPGCFPPARHPPPRAPPSSACRRTSVPGRTGV